MYLERETAPFELNISYQLSRKLEQYFNIIKNETLTTNRYNSHIISVTDINVAMGSNHSVTITVTCQDFFNNYIWRDIKLCAIDIYELLEQSFIRFTHHNKN